MNVKLTDIRWLTLYNRVLLIGVVIHELAHVLAIKLAGGTIVDGDLTSHVSHKGHYTVIDQFAISYAPLLCNTGLAVGAAIWAITPEKWLPDQIHALTNGVLPAAVTTPLMEASALIFAFLVSASALPSYQDASNLYSTFRYQLSHLSIFRVLILPLEILILLIGVIPLSFTYLRQQSPLLHITSELSFATLIVLQATGVTGINLGQVMATFTQYSITIGNELLRILLIAA